MSKTILGVVFFFAMFGACFVWADEVVSNCKPTPELYDETSVPEEFSTTNNLRKKTSSLYAAEGRPIVILGRVVDSKCTPVTDAKVLLWQTNNRGFYQHAKKITKKSEEEFDECSGKGRGDVLGLKANTVDGRANLMESVEDVENFDIEKTSDPTTTNSAKKVGKNDDVKSVGPSEQGFVDEYFSATGIASTDNLGYFKFVTIAPGAQTGREPHVNIIVEHDDFPTLRTSVFLEQRTSIGGEVFSRELHDSSLAKVSPELRGLLVARFVERKANVDYYRINIGMDTDNRYKKY